MYAIFTSGGKQEIAKEGTIIQLDKLNNKIGEIIEFNKILMISNEKKIKIGTPFIKKSKISAKVISHIKGKKIKITKFLRRKHSKKQKGHRQWFTQIKIINIT